MSDKLQVTALTVKNFAGCKAFQCEPGERALVLVAGRNGAGKSSALGSLTWGLLGADFGPAVPVRRGAAAAEVTIALDGGRYVVTRRETANGTRTLTVRNAEGARFDKPQAMLDKLLGAKFLDPVAFAGLKPAPQREALLKLAPVAIDLTANAAERKATYDERTVVNRRVVDAEGELKALPEPGEGPVSLDAPEAERSVAELLVRRYALDDERRANDAKRAELTACERRGREQAADVELAAENVRRTLADLAKDEARIERENTEADADLEREITALRQRHDAAKARRVERFAAAKKTAAEDMADAKRAGELAAQAVTTERAAYVALKAECDALTDPDPSTIDADLAGVEEHNQGVRARRAAQEQRERDYAALTQARGKAAAKVAKAREESKLLTAKLDALDKARTDALAAVPMPLPDLAIGDDGLLWRGVPFEQASDGERVRISVAVAMALSPGLRDLIIRDGCMLDDGNLAALAAQAEAAGYRLWVERVGTGDDGALVFVDGEIVQPAKGNGANGHAVEAVAPKGNGHASPEPEELDF